MSDERMTGPVAERTEDPARPLAGATQPTNQTPPEEEVAPGGFVNKVIRNQQAQILMILVIIVAIFGLLQPAEFLTPFNARGIAINTAIYAVLGVGMTMVIITAGIDLSAGSVLVCSAVVSSLAMRALGGEGWGVAFVGLVAAVLTGLLWGLLNGFLIAKAKVPTFIVTLGTFQAALGVAQVLTGGIDLRVAPTVLVDTIGFGNLFGQLPNLVVVSAIVVALGAILLHRTRFGLYTYAVGSNPEAARRAGIKVDRHLISVYALHGALCGFAGLLNLAFYQSTTLGGQSLTSMNVISGVALGGTSMFGGFGTILGTVIGLFIPTTLQNGFVILGIQPFWQLIVVGAVLVAAVYVDQRRRAAATRSVRKTRARKALLKGKVS